MKPKAPYKTRQQALILQHFATLAGQHTTVAQMAAALRAAGTPIGTATLYRQLDKLEQAGLVRRYTLDDVPGTCYEYLPPGGHCDDHLHLKCEQCGVLVHLECHHADGFQAHIKAQHGFLVNHTKTVLYGTCESCANPGAGHSQG